MSLGARFREYRVGELLAFALCAAACGVSESEVPDTRATSASGDSTGAMGAGDSLGAGGSDTSGDSRVGVGSTGGSSVSGDFLTSRGGSSPIEVGTSREAAGAGGTSSSGVANPPGTAPSSNGAGGSELATSSPGAGSGQGAVQGGGLCPSDTNLALAVHVSFPVTWPATTAAGASSGTQTAHIRWLSKYSVDGTKLNGTQQTCSLSLPDVQLNAIGVIAAGGSKIQIEIPTSVWAVSSMPKFSGEATMSGWDPGGSFSFSPGLGLVGLALPSSVDAATMKWPSSSWNFPAGTTFSDGDGDSKPGITATPLNGNGYVYPPVQVGLGGLAPAADKVYIVSRNRIGLSGKWTSCNELSGTATVALFDNHVVGCHVRGGSECTTDAVNTQADFLDQNRTVYTPGTASFTAKKLPNDATCSDVLAALR